MKIQKSLLSTLALAFAASTVHAQLEKPFSTINDYTLIVGGDATLNGAHIEGSGFIGGNLTNSGVTETGVNTNLTTGLTVIGTTSGTGTIKYFKDAFFGTAPTGVDLQDLNGAKITTTNPFGSTNPFDLVNAASDQLGQQSDFGATWDATVSNGPVINLTSKVINFLTLSPSDISGLLNDANLNFTGLDEDTYLVVNIDQGSDLFDFNRLQVQNTGNYGGNIFWNFLGDGTIKFNSPTFRSNLIAPDALVSVQTQSTYGQVVAGSLTDESGGGAWENRPYANWTAPIPETSTIAMLALTGFVTLFGFRRRLKQN